GAGLIFVLHVVAGLNLASWFEQLNATTKRPQFDESIFIASLCATLLAAGLYLSMASSRLRSLLLCWSLVLLVLNFQPLANAVLLHFMGTGMGWKVLVAMLYFYSNEFYLLSLVYAAGLLAVGIARFANRYSLQRGP
ncbi:MAG: hypothetical protein ABL901_16480, partial [Hyphomicrobiaceae bacterium]